MTCGLRKLRILLALALFSLFQPSSHAEPPNAEFECWYMEALFPCNRLKRPIETDGGIFSYMPTKWIPVWPNNSVFGAPAGKEPWSDDGPHAHLTESRTSANQARDVEHRPVESPTFDRQFIDSTLAAIHGWSFPSAFRYLRLVDADRVYSGEKIYEFWLQSLSVGVVCHNFDVEYAIANETERHCAFSRIEASGALRQIEYCVVEVHLPSNIFEETTCTVVASERDGHRKILAARFPQSNFQGGASAGEYGCVVPAKSVVEVFDALRGFVAEIIGASSKFYSGRDNDGVSGGVSYKAEGINIADKDEKVFMRAYIFGAVANRKSNQTKFSINFDLTISAQASENIIDYRQPSQAMTDRLTNKIRKMVEKFVKSLSRHAYCRASFDWGP